MQMKLKDMYREYKNLIDKEVTISGWIRTLRDSKNFAFIELNDGTFFKSVQIVLDDELSNFQEVVKYGVGTAITVKGKIVESVGSKQTFEIKASNIILEGASPSDYPLQKKRHTQEYLRTIAHLRPRTNLYSAVFRVRSLVCFAIHQFFNERGFIYVHTPIITASDAEGAGEMFQVTTLNLKDIPKDSSNEVDYKEDFFGKSTNLTVSGQLSAESFAHAFRETYTFGPTFRAENSNTSRHAAEFWMVEPEIAFADLSDLMKLAEDMIKYIIGFIFENAPEEMEFFNNFVDKGLYEKLNHVARSDFASITYTEAVEILLKSNAKFEYPVSMGMDIQTEHERYLTEQVFQKPLFLTDYPKEVKAFYMRMNDDDKTVAAMDLLVPGIGEIIGGSQREERMDILEKRMEEMGLDKEAYWWYLDLRKYGGVKHAGFGLGLERMIMYITGVSNIRDVIPFPRTVRNADF